MIIDTRSNLEKNNILLEEEEIAYEIDKDLFKIGDGKQNYNSIGYDIPSTEFKNEVHFLWEAKKLSIPGKNGNAGVDGKDGIDGKDGTDGKDGIDGKQGLDGKDGKDGKDGQNGTDGKDGDKGDIGVKGKDGRDGLDGNDGINGKNGIDGKDGLSIKGDKGEPGKDGKDGSRWLRGKGEPDQSLGNNEDVYFNTFNGNFYQKINGKWILLTTFDSRHIHFGGGGGGGSSPGGGAVTSVNGLVGVVPLTGTLNRITISAANVFDIGTDVVTLTGAQALTNKTGLISQWTNDSGYLTSAGTVTSVSVVTNQGVSGSVANATTTPAITLTLGALTGVTSFNGLVVTANTGAITTGTWTATAVGATFGGTGQTVYAVGDLLYANTTTTLSKLADVATGNALISGGVGVAPSWGQISLTTTVTGVLPLANGGTNANLTASNGGIFYSTATAGAILAGTATASKMLLSGATAAPTWSTSTIPTSAGATANKVLLSDGTNYVLSTPTFPNASATSGKTIRSDGTNWIASTATLSDAPSTAGKLLISDGTNWITSTPTYPNVATGTGTILRADGTNWVATTNTYPTTTGAGQILYATSANVIGSSSTFVRLSTGEVGIGGSNAGIPLTVIGNANSFQRILMENDTSGTASSAAFQIQSNDGASGNCNWYIYTNSNSYTTAGLIQKNMSIMEHFVATATSNGVLFLNDHASPFIFSLGGSAITNEAMRINGTSYNVKIGIVGGSNVVRATTEGTHHLDIFDGTAPVGTLANGISLYSTAGELRVMDSGGTATLLSPHSKELNEIGVRHWVYDSVDTVTKTRLIIDMEKMMKAINKKFGWDFVKQFSID